MKKVLGGLILAAGSVLAAPHVAFSVGVGVPAPAYVAPAPAVVAAVPPCPGPGYTWVAGGWYYVGGRRIWREGYWAPPVAHFRDHDRDHFRDRDHDRR
jgi:hypothetical protein